MVKDFANDLRYKVRCDGVSRADVRAGHVADEVWGGNILNVQMCVGRAGVWVGSGCVERILTLF